MALSSRLRLISFADLAGWRDEDAREAYAAFRRSALQSARKAYRSGSLGIDAEALGESFAAAGRPMDDDPKAFFERWFLPFRIDPAPASDGFVTGFYEPVLAASPMPTPRFRFPLLRRPDDLIEIGPADRPPGLDTDTRFARRVGSTIEPYYDRAAIDDGALAGRGLEIAWLEDRFDTFLVHVQGAARLKLIDGGDLRVTYAAKTGHPFTGPGATLVALGELQAETVTLPAIKAWFAAHPERIEEVLRRNRSYIFFRETAVEDGALGPVAAAKVQLTPGRSLAVDRDLHTFGTPFYIEAPTLTAFDKKPFRRLMIAQDTGSAIVGPARGDLFAGSGPAAEAIAGVVRHPAQFTVLVPRLAVA